MAVRAKSFPETIRAVVLGIGKCSDAGLSELPAVAGEAQRLHEVLVSPDACRIPEENISFLSAPDATREHILSALQQRAGEAADGDILFIYFAGHGIDHNGSFAFVPADGATANHQTLITARDLGLAFAGTKARGIFIAADCCGGAAIYENARALFGNIGSDLEFHILLSSSKAGESSWEIRGRGSPFTIALVEALQGNMAGIGQQGEIYFTALMAHVIARVEELLESEYSDLPQQHPNFDGSYQKDPLLFLNGDIAIGRLVLKIARYSPEYVRRRVRMTVGGLIAVLTISILAYWTWIDQHLFVQLDGVGLSLYHGYPGFPWPGMPRRLWQFAISRVELLPNSPLVKEGGLLILPKEQNVGAILARLEPHLTTIAKIYVAGWQGQTDKVREMAKAVLDAKSPTLDRSAALNIYASYSKWDDDDKALFASIIQNDKVIVDVVYAFATLIRIDPDRAIAAFNDSDAAPNPNVLYGVRLLHQPCSQKTRFFLSDKLIKSDHPNLAEFGINATIQAQCTEPALPLFAREAFQTKALGYFSRFLSDRYRNRFMTRVLKDIQAAGANGWQNEQDENGVGRWTEQLAFSGAGPCNMNLIDWGQQASLSHQLDIIDYLLNSCPDLSFSLIQEVGGNSVEIQLLSGVDVKAEVLFLFEGDEKSRDRALDFVQRRGKIADNGYLIDEPIDTYLGARDNWETTVAEMQNAVNALKWAVQLKYCPKSVERLVLDPQEPALVRKWALLAALHAAPDTGLPLLFQRYGDFSFDFENFVKMIVAADLPPQSIAQIRTRTRRDGEHNLFNAALTALYGSKSEAVDLMLSAEASDRTAAGEFFAFRDDLAEIDAAIRMRMPPYGVGLANLLNELNAESAAADALLAGVPDWALDWRVAIARPFVGPPTGAQLKLLHAVVSRKTIGIERPFNEALLGFSW